jgi:signal peptide peptidase SppA
MSWLFDGSSMQAIGEAFRSAVADTQIRSILLCIDSPGGTVDGTQELANIIYNGKGEKNVIAFADGQMTSAAYWIGSAADELYISGDTVVTGSIGVIATHVDVSAQDAQYGEKYTLITAGKYKANTTMHAPLSTEGRQTIQEMVDHIYSVFIGEVARNRNVSEESALKMADGKLFIGKQAVEVGLVDGVSTYDQLINKMSAGAPGIKTFKAKEENPIMDAKELKEKHPDIFQAIFEQGRSSVQSMSADQINAKVGEGIIYGAQLENQRITAIHALAVPGHESIIEAAVKNPTVSAGDVAMQIVAAEKKVRTDALNDFETDAAGVKRLKVPGVDTDLNTGKDKPDAFTAEVEKVMAEKKCTRGEAISIVAKAQPELHKKYLAAINKAAKAE